jgi:hypothetical protein
MNDKHMGEKMERLCLGPNGFDGEPIFLKISQTKSDKQMKVIHYINLTNGIRAIEDYGLQDYRVIRLQSTWCEQKLFDEILFTISDDLLLNLAIGNKCIIYDYGANKEVPRAIWQGVEWLKFVLWKRWFDIDYEPKGRSVYSKKYFGTLYQELSRSVKAKLDYYKKFCIAEDLDLHCVSSSMKEDPNLYKKVWKMDSEKREFIYSSDYTISKGCWAE